MPDLIIRHGTLVMGEDLLNGDIAIEGGRICAIGSDLAGACEEIDATGLTVFPGLIDTHVHFNEPGRTEWEGARSGSHALAAGGGTLFGDMPLNSTPCTVTCAEFEQKRAALARSSITDFAIWGGLIPGNLEHLADLAAHGVLGFKAFMSDSGLSEFPRADDVTLYEGMREAATLGLPVAVHAESEELTKGLAHRAQEYGRVGIRDYLKSRPILAEVEAIRRAAFFAGTTGCKLHVVHVSSAAGVAAALEARAQGTDVTVETCPHYLYFNEEDLERLGAVAKCAPPIRAERERIALWQAVLDRTVDFVASDHSPSSPELKTGYDFFTIWGGIAGVQSTLPVLLTEGHHERGMPLGLIANLIATNPARRYRFEQKGRLAVGYDADLCLVDLNTQMLLTERDLLQRHRISPYLFNTFRGQVRRTIRRGETIFSEGRIVSETPGQLIRPAQTSYAPPRIQPQLL